MQKAHCGGQRREKFWGWINTTFWVQEALMFYRWLPIKNVTSVTRDFFLYTRIQALEPNTVIFFLQQTMFLKPLMLVMWFFSVWVNAEYHSRAVITKVNVTLQKEGSETCCSAFLFLQHEISLGSSVPLTVQTHFKLFMSQYVSMSMYGCLSVLALWWTGNLFWIAPSPASPAPCKPSIGCSA